MTDEWDSRLTWDVYLPTDEGLECRIGGWVMRSTWPERRKHDRVEVTVSVDWTGKRRAVAVPKMRLNLLSGSGRGELTRGMRAVNGRDELEYERVPLLVNAFIADLISWYEQGQGDLEDLTATRDHVTTPERWLLYPIWPATGATGVAAAPGSFKSYTGLAIALSVAYGTSILHGNTEIPDTEERSILYLDWEADRDTMRARAVSLMRGGGLMASPGKLDYLPMMHPLADIALSVADRIRTKGYAGVVVDSMSAAIGGSMVDDDSVNAFWSAIAGLGVPSLVIAHKSLENQRKRTPAFFGSAMSIARVRMAWNAEVGVDEKSPAVVWECFKDNNLGLRGTKVAWELDFATEGEGMNRAIRSVSYDAIPPEALLFEQPDHTLPQREPTQLERAVALLENEGPMTVAALADALGSSPASIRNGLLKRNPEWFERNPQTHTVMLRQGSMVPVAGRDS